MAREASGGRSAPHVNGVQPLTWDLADSCEEALAAPDCQQAADPELMGRDRGGRWAVRTWRCQHRQCSCETAEQANDV